MNLFSRRRYSPQEKNSFIFLFYKEEKVYTLYLTRVEWNLGIWERKLSEKVVENFSQDRGG